MRIAPLLVPAALLCALVPSSAAAACLVSPTLPADGGTATNSPTFRWSATADCTSFRVLFATDAAFTTDLSSSPTLTRRDYRLPEAGWESRQAGAWADGVYWRVLGFEAAGASARSDIRFLAMDPDFDDDGVSVGAGDCDDLDPTVYPGAPEACDGVDADCDGSVEDGAAAGYASFSGAGDRLTGTDAHLPSGNAPRTVAAWVRTSSGVEQYAVAWGTWTWDQGYHLGTLSGAAVLTDIGTHLAGGAVSDGVWHHVAETSNGSSHALYVDGALVATSGFDFSTVLNQLAVGSTNDGALAGAKPWTGDVDEVAIWSRWLEADEIATLYADGPDFSDTSLVAWYPFDDTCGAEGDGFTVLDEISGASLQAEGDETWPRIELGSR